MKFRHAVLLGSLLLGAPAQAPAQGLPVIDPAALLKWINQAQQMAQVLTQLEAQLHALTDIPQDLIQQTEGLIAQAVSNPLGQIMQNLQTLLRGQGPGTCGNAQVYLTTNTYQQPVGTDFTAQQLNQSISRQAGLQACTQQMMQASQTTLGQLPALLGQLQGATDITQATAISARINVQIATMQAQQQQAQLLAQSGLLQAQMTQEQTYQKQRNDAWEVYKNTQPGAAQGVVPQVQPFQAVQAGG